MVIKIRYICVNICIALVTFVSSLVTIYSINFFKEQVFKFKVNKKFFFVNNWNVNYNFFKQLNSIFYCVANNFIFFFLLVNRKNANDTYINSSKIFLHNRISDLAFLLSVYLLYTLNNSIYFEIIFENNNFVNNNILFWGITISRAELAVFLLFFSCLLRFRQFFISNCIYDVKNLNIPTLTLIFCSALLPLIIFYTFRFFPLIFSTPNFLNTMIPLSFV